MPDITVVNATRRPVDLPTGQVLAPGETVDVVDSEQLQRKVDLGLLDVITGPDGAAESQEPAEPGDDGQAHEDEPGKGEKDEHPPAATRARRNARHSEES